MNAINKVGVIGAGIMGHGIAQSCAQAGERILLIDTNEQALADARTSMEKNLKLLIANGFLHESPDEILSRVEFAVALEKVKDVDLVIEAIPEKLFLKENLFNKLGKICRPDCILASNTSSIPITKLAGVTEHPERILGTHFFQPAQLIPLVEIIQTEQTDEKVIEATMNFMTAIGKKPARVKKDIPGFVANRLQQALAREALSLVQKGVVTAEDLDTIVTTSFALRMVLTGPIQQKDLNGLDTFMSVTKQVCPDLEDTKKPLAILEAKIASGELGLKTGKGFYDWAGKSAVEVYNDKNKGLIDLLKFLNSRKA